MIGNLLLSFFIAMPAVVVFSKRNTVTHPLSRALLGWGGALAVLCALIVVLPLLGCKGSMLSGYTSCVGGAGVSALVGSVQPLIVWAAKLYVLAGIPLAVLAFALDQTGRRKV